MVLDFSSRPQRAWHEMACNSQAPFNDEPKRRLYIASLHRAFPLTHFRLSTNHRPRAVRAAAMHPL